jgi:hypothetical protein
MKKDAADTTRGDLDEKTIALIEQIAKDFSVFAEDFRVLGKHLSNAKSKWDEAAQEMHVVHWVGGLTHDFYTGLEKAFREISPS